MAVNWQELLDFDDYRDIIVNAPKIKCSLPWVTINKTQNGKSKISDLVFFYLVRPRTFRLRNIRAVSNFLNSMCLYTCLNMQCTIFVTGMKNCGKISFAKSYIFFIKVVNSLESCSLYTVIYFRFMNRLCWDINEIPP